MEERLRKFAYLVDAGSFTKASAQLHVSQPALSTAITKLERELRTPLLVRGARSFQLTEAGKLAYTTARELSLSTVNLRTKLDILTNQPPSLAIGMIDSIAGALCSNKSYVEELEKHARISIVVNNSRYLMQAVERDELDIAYVAERSRHSSRATQLSHLSAEPLLLVCHSALTQKVNQALGAGMLPDFISYDQPSTTSYLINAALAKRGVQPTTTFYSTSPEVMLQLVLLKKGAAVLPYPLVRKLIAHKTLQWVGGVAPIVIERNIATARRSEKEIPPALIAITQHIKLLLDNHQQAASELSVDKH
jgi:DNA-binding transcriptional LysR family regulator